MKLRLFLFPALTGLILTGAILSACGGDDDDDDDSSSSSSSDDDDDKGGSLTGSGANDLRKLSKDLSKKTYSITYKFEGGGEDVDFDEMTLTQKPPKTATTIKSKDGDFTIIDDGKDSYLCSTDDKEGSCLKTPSSGSSGANTFGLDSILSELDEDVEVKSAGNKTIAGRSAKCFDVKTVSEGTNTVCVDAKDGFMLYAEGESDGEKFKMTATKVSTSVNDSVFDPPYEVVSLGGN